MSPSITSINIIKYKFKQHLDNKNTVEKELLFLKDTLLKIVERFMCSVDMELIKNIDNKIERKIDYANSILQTFPSKLSIRYLYKETKPVYILKLSKIKSTLIELTTQIGINSLTTLIKLHFDENIILSEPIINHIEFLNNIEFNIIKCEVNNNKYSNNTVIYNELNPNSDNVFLSINGCKIVIPLDNSLLCIHGYFKADYLNTYRDTLLIKDKYIQLQSVLNNNKSINNNYKINYLDTLTPKDFLIYNVNQLESKCISDYNQLVCIKHKNISTIVKEFLIGNVIYKRYLLQLLLLDHNEADSIYLAELLIDLTKNEQLQYTNTYTLLYQNIHWRQKKFLKDYDTYIKFNKQLPFIDEQIIPYDKRIKLMKAPEYVKSKAMDKLKEINNNKLGESNTKAQQYLDGLLKIPFGMYKTTEISSKMEKVLSQINSIVSYIDGVINILEENYILSDEDLKITEKIQTYIKVYNDKPKNPIYTDKLITLLKNSIYTLLGYGNDTDINFVSYKKWLGDAKKEVIVELCNELKLNNCKTKKANIQLLLNNKYTYEQIRIVNYYINKDIPGIYTSLVNTSEINEIKNKIDEASIIWNKYLIEQNKYFNDLSDILDKSVYGLNEAKRQIKRILAQTINGVSQGCVIGFEGPPGTGKTTLAKEGIARCLRDENGNTMPFVFIPLGGSSNGSTLEGHSYTYVSLTWGRIVDGLQESKCMNPIIYIDELDKISKSEYGKEIVGILTHMFDPSQNNEFMDKYFAGIKLDISKCIIIVSYNDADLIDSILLDRITRINIEPLNKIDKVQVCKNYIIPSITKHLGIDNDDIILRDDDLIHIIDTYTYEAGARKIKEKLQELYGEIVLLGLSNLNIQFPYTITRDYINDKFKHHDKFEISMIHNEPVIGLINGLYATSLGIGGITVIECYKFYTGSHLELKLTGMQGDIMKESMSVAKTLAFNLIPEQILCNIKDESNKFGIHIHCPAGATPKDGPSAGTAITVVIISLLCNIPIRNTIAITGEIDLNGNVLPIGGLDSKIIGGKLAGVKQILCPKKNKDDLDKIRLKHNNLETDNFMVNMIDNIYMALDNALVLPNDIKAIDYFKKLR